MTEGRAIDLRNGERVRWTAAGGDYATTKGPVWCDKKTKRLMAWILCEASEAEFHVPVSELEALDVEAQRELLEAAENALRLLEVASFAGSALAGVPVTKRLAAAVAAARETP